MKLFGRTAIDDPELARLVGRRRVLAAGRCRHGQVVGMVGSLAYRSAAGAVEIAWHEVERGGWDGQARSLRWRTVDGREDALELTESGLLPDLFNERVTASVVCVRTIELPGSGTALVTARRNLGEPDAPLVWRVTPGPEASTERVTDDPRVAGELARLKAEFEPG